MSASNTKATSKSAPKPESKSASKAAPELIPSFEHAFAELKSIVAQMESGQMSLEASLAAYKRGDFLLQFCQKSLAEVEQQVQILNDRNQLVQFKPEHD
ncbi:MAG: exodeoxyribonuclease VII small subunit [Methylotenera sp.]